MHTQILTKTVSKNGKILSLFCLTEFVKLFPRARVTTVIYIIRIILNF